LIKKQVGSVYVGSAVKAEKRNSDTTEKKKHLES